MQVDLQDEIGIVADALNKTTAQYTRSNEASLQVTTDELADTAGQMAAAAEEVAASVEEVASTTNHFSSTLEAMNSNVQSMNKDVQEVAERASSGENTIRDIVEQIGELSEDMQRLADEVSGRCSL